MEDIKMDIDFSKIIYDSNLIMAIIAINMTVIGLTSLAETKRVIGVDYGKFLVRKYRVFKRIRIYELLIAFAIINVGSLLLIFIKNQEFRLLSFLLLLATLMFAIYYFFAYIIAENPRVRRQIYEDELAGLYFANDNKDHQEADVLTKMSNGSRTSKKLSSNVIHYFNIYNSDSQIAFEETFGPDSVIYYPTENMKKVLSKDVLTPYHYRDLSGVKDISYEYFQLFRSSELQDKWTLEILRLFDGNRQLDKGFNIIRLYNFSRVVTHINLFGQQDNIYRYKFLQYLCDFYLNAMKMKEYEKQMLLQAYGEHTLEVEKYTLRQLMLYMFDPDGERRNKAFIEKAKQKMADILLSEHSFLSIKERVNLFVDYTMEVGTEDMKQVLTDVMNFIFHKQTEEASERLTVDEIKDMIRLYRGRDTVGVEVSMEELFGVGEVHSLVEA
jgi:hypothetical protein